MIHASALSRVTRAARAVFATSDDGAFWTISLDGRVIGSLVRERGACRLSWFAGADPRLAADAGPLNAEIGALADRFAARLGARSAGAARLAIVSAPF